MKVHFPDVVTGRYDPPGNFRQMAIRASMPGAWNFIGYQAKARGKPILRWCWPREEG